MFPQIMQNEFPHNSSLINCVTQIFLDRPCKAYISEINLP